MYLFARIEVDSCGCYPKSRTVDDQQVLISLSYLFLQVAVMSSLLPPFLQTFFPNSIYTRRKGIEAKKLRSCKPRRSRRASRRQVQIQVRGGNHRIADARCRTGAGCRQIRPRNGVRHGELGAKRTRWECGSQAMGFHVLASGKVCFFELARGRPSAKCW